MRKESLRASNGSRLTRSKLNRWRERNPRNPTARKICVSDWLSRFHRSMEDKMKKAFVLAVLLIGMLLPVSQAQDKPKQDDKPKAETPATTPVKVQIVFTEFEGDKKVKSLPYTLYINAPDAPEWHSSSFVKLRVGSRVPVYTGGTTGSMTYLDVGTNIDARAAYSVDGRLLLQLNVERSWVEGDVS